MRQYPSDVAFTPAVKRVQTDGSYCASGDPRVVFGLDQDQAAQTVRVHWGPGDVEEFRGLAADRYWRLERGKPAAAGTPAAAN